MGLPMDNSKIRLKKEVYRLKGAQRIRASVSVSDRIRQYQHLLHEGTCCFYSHNLGIKALRPTFGKSEAKFMELFLRVAVRVTVSTTITRTLT